MSQVLAQLSASAVNIPTTTETAVITTGVLNSAENNIHLWGTMVMLIGTGATGVTVRIRQGSGIGGAVVGSYPVENATAGQTVEFGYDFYDALFTLTGAAGGQYTLTVQQTAATAAGTVNNADLTVEQQ